MKDMLLRKFYRKYYGYIGFFVIVAVPVVILLAIYAKDFDETLFDVDHAYNHIEELSSQKYGGRLPGTDGNVLALGYIEDYFRKIGLEPAGDQGTYYQYFKAMVPVYQYEPSFHILDEKGNIVKAYKIREHYRDFFYGSGEIQGDLLYATKHIQNYLPEEIGKRIVVYPYPLEKEDVQCGIDCGVKGFLQAPDHERWGSVPVRMTKSSSDIKKIEHEGELPILFSVDRSTYFELKNYALEGYKTKINYGYAFQMFDVPNILGKIEGTDKDSGYVIISAHVDHVGSDYDGRYFPGAMDDASGIGMMMELARVMKMQDRKPEKTIFFVGWNMEEGGLQGSKYYVQHPLFPLEKTQVIQLDCIGSADFRELVLGIGNKSGQMLAEKLYQFTEILGIQSAIVYEGASDHGPFAEKNIPAVLLIDNLSDRSNVHYLHMVKDDIYNISKEHLETIASLLLHYIKREIYKDFRFDYLHAVERVVIALFLIWGLSIYFFHLLFRFNPAGKLFKYTIEDIYSVIYNILAKLYQFFALTFMVVFVLAFISHVPANFNLQFKENGFETNASVFIVIEKSIIYIRSLFTNGLGSSIRNIDVGKIIAVSFGKSLGLIFAALAISCLIGITIGILNGYREKEGNCIKHFGAVIILSVPDVFIVVLVQLLMVIMSKNHILDPIMTKEAVRKFIIPLFCLSVLPTVYISRITSVVIQEEKKKEYVKAAKARGISPFRVLFGHLMVSVLFRTIDSLSSVLTMIISNLIVIEYLFHYPGVIFMLFKSYREYDTTTFIGLSLTLGFMFILFSTGFRVLSYLLNPMERKGVQ